MRRALAVALVSTAWAAPAQACSVQAAPQSGPEPLTVALTAVDCTGSAFHWSLGGAPAEGPSVTHTFARGSYAVSLTTDDGVFRSQPIFAYGVVLARPRLPVRYGEVVRLRGTAMPPGAGKVSVNGTTARGLARGAFRVAFRVTGPGPFVARYKGASSRAVFLLVRPKLTAVAVGSASVGSRLALRVRLRPAAAGAVRVRIGTHVRTIRGVATIRLSTTKARTYRVRLSIVPAKGFTAPGRTLTIRVVEPNLGPGSRGPSVRALEEMLAGQRYALEGADGSYGQDTVDAVLAFQKVHGLARTGRVDRALWHAIERAHTPAARYAGDHVEVDKTTQVLYVVRGGKVTLVVHVSTGATGNTPVGRWNVYRKVTGFDWVLYYPSYFLRGFAIHGYPFVPAYPASHGCVRVPMWVASRLYAEIPPGTPIDVYL